MAIWDNVFGCWLLDEVSGTRYDSSPAGRHLLESGPVPSMPGLFDYAAAWDKDHINTLSRSSLNLDASNGVTMAIWAKVLLPPGWWTLAGSGHKNYLVPKFIHPSYNFALWLWIYAHANSRLDHPITVYSAGWDDSDYNDMERYFTQIPNRWALYMVRLSHAEMVLSVDTRVLEDCRVYHEGLSGSSAWNGGDLSLYINPQNPTDPSIIMCNGLTIWEKVLTTDEEREYYNEGNGLKFGDSGSLIVPVSTPIACWDMDEKVGGIFYEDYQDDRYRLEDRTAGYYIGVEDPPVTKLVRHSSDGLLGDCVEFNVADRPLYSQANPTLWSTAHKSLNTGIWLRAKEHGLTMSFWYYFMPDFPYSEDFPYNTDPPDATLSIYFGDLGEVFEGSLGIYRGGWSEFPVPGGPIYSREFLSHVLRLANVIGSPEYIRVNGQSEGIRPEGWHMITVRINSIGTMLFIDGVQFGENLSFTKESLYNGFYLVTPLSTTRSGTITLENYVRFDQFTVWEEGLDDYDIIDLYNSGLGRPCLSGPPPTSPPTLPPTLPPTPPPPTFPPSPPPGPYSGARFPVGSGMCLFRGQILMGAPVELPNSGPPVPPPPTDPSS